MVWVSVVARDAAGVAETGAGDDEGSWMMWQSDWVMVGFVWVEMDVVVVSGGSV